MCKVTTGRLLALTMYLGFIHPNLAKCDFIPSQFFNFVGTHYLLPLSRVAPTSAHKISIENKVSTFLLNDTRSAKQFQSLIGRLSFAKLSLLTGWTDGQNAYPSPSVAASKRLVRGDHPHTQVRVPHSMHCHLRWWGCSRNLSHETCLHEPKPEAIVFTDASDAGWGAHSQGEEIQGTWLPSEASPSHKSLRDESSSHRPSALRTHPQR